MRKIKYLRGAIVGAVLVAALAMTVGAAARFQRGGHGPGGPGGSPDPARMVAHMTEALGLSEAQAAQVKQILTDEQSRVAQYAATIDSSREQLRTATANGQFDEAKVRQIATAQSAAMTEMIVEHERTRAAIYNVLTPEQREKAEKMHRPDGGPFGPPDGKRF